MVLANMSPDEIRALRKAISLTQRELADALEQDIELVRGWERGETFPTRASVLAMEKLRENPPRKAPKKSPTVWQLLGDAAFMSLLRKLLANPRLRGELERLAKDIPDPLDE